MISLQERRMNPSKCILEKAEDRHWGVGVPIFTEEKMV